MSAIPTLPSFHIIIHYNYYSTKQDLRTLTIIIRIMSCVFVDIINY